MNHIKPDLNEARRLLASGVRLIKLEPMSKRPLGFEWNQPHNYVTQIDPEATGYGFPLPANKACSIDPDNWKLACIGMTALGFDLETIMSRGVRTVSTRLKSGGRSAFAEEPDLGWLRFSSSERDIGTVIEFRAGSTNLQDAVPGLVYLDKEGNECTQAYVGERRLDDLPGLPDDLLNWWQRCSTDCDFYREQQAKFFAAIGMSGNLAISTPKGDGVLAFDAPGYRGPYNREKTVESILERHGYNWHPREQRWSPPIATGAPGVRPIPGKNGQLWRSDHASDPLSGTFDAWVAHVVLDHGGDLEAAKKEFDETLTLKSPEPNNITKFFNDEVNEPDSINSQNSSMDDGSDLDAELIASRLPEIDPIAFYGPLAKLVETATDNSEATKVGVAIHTLTSLSAYFARPFYIPIADERVGINIFTVQVGPSALARKGTSAATADRRLMPALLKKAQELAQRIESSREAVIHDLAERARINYELEGLFDKRSAVINLKHTDLAVIKEKIDDLCQAIELKKQRLAAWKEKSSNPILSPRSLKDYERFMSEANSELDQQNAELLLLENECQHIAKALADPDAVISELDAQIERLAVSLKRPPVECQQTEGWMHVLAGFAVPPLILRSLASGEGLVWAIRDDQIDKDGELRVGVSEKRLFINMSEFGGALSVMRRPGNTLGALIRDAYDLQRLETNGKVEPCSVESYSCNLSAAITPAELASLMFDSKDINASADNGVGNRPIYVFCRRGKLVSRPTPTANVDDIAEAIWTNICLVYQALSPNGLDRCVEFQFSEEGAAVWDTNYARLDALCGSSANAQKLHGRITTNCRKLAALLAFINGEHVINAQAVLAAIAWMEYASKTIDAVASSQQSRLEHAKTKDQAQRVWKAVQTKTLVDDHTGEVTHPTRKIIQQITGYKADQVKAAINYLCSQAPPLIRIHERVTPNNRKTAYFEAIGQWR